VDFNEKLDFLMKLTNTSNSMLARHIAMDPSFVSRLRSGTRKPSKNEDYIEPISRFLSKRCTEDYQRDGLFDALGINQRHIPTDPTSISGLMISWLQNRESTTDDSILSLIKNIDEFSFKKPQTQNTEAAGLPLERMDSGTYVGIEWKRQCVLAFLSAVIQSPSPQTLLLYSNEDLEWLAGDPAFTAKWAALFFEVLKRGNNVKIVHTVSRSLDEMLTAIKEWLPFYMTGRIEPMYYPKTMDGVFRRTMFIAPETCALISNSVGSVSSSSVNNYFTDQTAIKAYELEFADFLRQCRPLMKIFNPISAAEHLESMVEFENEDGDIMIRSRILSSFTFPQFLLERILKELNHPDKASMLTFHRIRLNRLIQSLATNRITEIVVLPAIEDIKEKRIPIGFSTMFSEKEIPYDQYTMKAHLENIVSLLKHHENYNVALLDSSDDDLSIYIKENVGLFVLKYSIPSITFAINEQGMTSAFWNYLKLKMKQVTPDKSGKENTIKAINDYIKRMGVQ
jgi:hypothetical protein